MNKLKPIDVAVALSLYAYNVDAGTRARKLYDHFKGDCMELNELVTILNRYGQFAATELPPPTAEVYVDHAIEKYGKEAVERNRANGI